jgi:antitoxin YefM
MVTKTNVTTLRNNLSTVLDHVVDTREVVIVRRRPRRRNIALISADELSSLLETLYLLQSPANAKRLLASLERVKRERS